MSTISARRDNMRRLLDALKYLGVPIHDFGNGPAEIVVI